MIKWTTPSLKCTIPEGIDFDYILMTLTQGNIVLEKTINASDVVDNSFTVFFTQEETGSFKTDIKVRCQLNLMYGSTRLATNIVDLSITQNLHNEVIDE